MYAVSSSTTETQVISMETPSSQKKQGTCLIVYLFLEAIYESKKSKEEKIKKYEKKFKCCSVEELILSYLLKGAKSCSLKKMEYKVCILHLVAIGALLDFDYERVGNEVEKLWIVNKLGKKDLSLFSKIQIVINELENEGMEEFEDSLTGYARFEEGCRFYHKCGRHYLSSLKRMAFQSKEIGRQLKESYECYLNSSSGSRGISPRLPKEFHGFDFPQLCQTLDQIGSTIHAYTRLLMPDIEAFSSNFSSWKERESLFRGLELHLKHSTTVLESHFSVLNKNKIIQLFEEQFQTVQYDEQAYERVEYVKKEIEMYSQKIENKDFIKLSRKEQNELLYNLNSTKEALQKEQEAYLISEKAHQTHLNFYKLAFGDVEGEKKGEYGLVVACFTEHIKNVMGLMEAWKSLTYFSTKFREHLVNRLKEMPKDEEEKDFDLMAFIDQLEQQWGPTKKSKRKKALITFRVKDSGRRDGQDDAIGDEVIARAIAEETSTLDCPSQPAVLTGRVIKTQKKAKRKRDKEVQEKLPSSKKERTSPSVQKKEKHSASVKKKEIKQPVESLIRP